VALKADQNASPRHVAQVPQPEVRGLALRSASFKMPSPERIATALKKHKMEVLEAPGTA
jgi:hypothetical protein